MTAPAALVAAWPDGSEVPTVAPRRGSASSIRSNGRALAKIALSPMATRSAAHTVPAVSAVVAATGRRAHTASAGASATQTRPA